MNFRHRTLVHHLIASHLGVEPSAIEDGARFEELGVDDLDLVLVVLRIEDLEGRGECDEFPFEALERAKTVADLLALVDLWLFRDTAPPSRSSAA